MIFFFCLKLGGKDNMIKYIKFIYNIIKFYYFDLLLKVYSTNHLKIYGELCLNLNFFLVNKYIK